MTTSLIRRFLAVSLFACLLAPLAASADAYGQGGLTIREFEVKKNGDVHIVFRPMAETMYWCPGANAKVTPEGIELTFVRTGFKKRPEVDYPAKRVKETGDRVLVVPAKGKQIFVRDGKELVKLEAAAKWK